MATFAVTSTYVGRGCDLICELTLPPSLPQTFIYLAVQLCAGTSTAIFILLASASTFWLIFFKAEITYLLAIPVEVQEIGFYVLLPLALVCRVCQWVWPA